MPTTATGPAAFTNEVTVTTDIALTQQRYFEAVDQAPKRLLDVADDCPLPDGRFDVTVYPGGTRVHIPGACSFQAPGSPLMLTLRQLGQFTPCNKCLRHISQLIGDDPDGLVAAATMTTRGLRHVERAADEPDIVLAWSYLRAAHNALRYASDELPPRAPKGWSATKKWTQQAIGQLERRVNDVADQLTAFDDQLTARYPSDAGVLGDQVVVLHLDRPRRARTAHELAIDARWAGPTVERDDHDMNRMRFQIVPGTVAAWMHDHSWAFVPLRAAVETDTDAVLVRAAKLARAEDAGVSSAYDATALLARATATMH